MNKVYSQVPNFGPSQSAVQAVQFLTVNEVCAMTGLSRASVYRLAAIGKLPAPRQVGIKASRWLLSEISAWADSRQTGIRLAA